MTSLLRSLPAQVLHILALAWVALPAMAAPTPAPRIATIAIPGHPAFVAVAREVLQIQTEVNADFASQSGLVDDALRVPSFAPRQVAALTRRLRGAMARLRQLPWRRWSVDEQIDVRWVYANAERLDRELNVEQLYRHRPAAWLETLANNYIAILTYAPARSDALAAITARVPQVVAEIETLCKPTQVDAQVAQGLVDGIVSMLKTNGIAGSEPAIAALLTYRQKLDATAGAAPMRVVGRANYAWRLQRAYLLPWEPEALLALAEERLAWVDGELARLVPQLPTPAPLSPEQEKLAAELTQPTLLALYDAIQTHNRAAIEAAGFLTIPAGVGPVRTRVTPDAMVPLTGDGGSMNPPPPYARDDVGWWNVEHFKPDATLAARQAIVRRATQFQTNSMGPYAVHEGLPGHHLQLAIARLNPDPLRSLFQDPVQNEGWALYAEQLMWEQGGLGRSLDAEVSMLRSWRFRIRRVVYDIKVATGVWTLQEAADWKAQAEPGKGRIDPDIKRAVNWPAQLMSYFTGKEQILLLKADVKKKLGADYSERRFNDELLALGSVPYVFARAKLLGEPVPGF